MAHVRAVQKTPTKTVHAACPHDCPDTCAMLVNVKGHQVTLVQGDPEHPFTRGGLCVKVNKFLDRVYDPGRVLFPRNCLGLPMTFDDVVRVGSGGQVS